MIASTIPNYPDLVARYCDDVTSGKRTAGRMEILAVNRHLDDLDNAGDRGFVFDEDIATKACRFFSLYICHSIGEWAGQPFHLEPWQAFVWFNVQGWRHEDDHTRRFRKAFISVARKNGKTTFAAAATAQMIFHDFPVEFAGRAYCAATKKEQAALLWGETKRMIDSSQRLAPMARIMGRNNLTGGQIFVEGGDQSGTVFVPIGADSKTTDGLNPSVVWKDEIHEWRDRQRELYEKLSTGGAARKQPFEGIITTAGSDNSTIWAEEHEFCESVLEASAMGTVVDDTVFAAIYQIDHDDDPLDSDNWPKANPSLGVSVKLRYMETQANEAKAKPSAKNPFIRYHCNRRVASFSQSYPHETWQRGTEQFDPPQPGDLCFASFDLGRTNDWSAWSAVFPQEFTDSEGVSRWRFVIRSKAYCCRGVNVKTDYASPPYSDWIADGLLGFQNDEVIDNSELKQDIIDLSQQYELRMVPYDDSYAGALAISLFNEYSIPVRSFYQTHLRFNGPLIEFEKALIAGHIDHGNDPVLNFQAGNCEYKYDSAGRRMLDKGNQQRWKKIDAIVATIMAYAEATYHCKVNANDDILIG